MTSRNRRLCFGGVFDWDRAVARLDELNARVEDPSLWDDAAGAQALMRERTRLDQAIGAVRSLEQDLQDVVELAELAGEEGDEDLVREALDTLNGMRDTAAAAELNALLSGEVDGNSAFVEIHAGAGGTESCDWAAMLLRMYSRWAQARGFKTELMEDSPGEEAGIKSATLRVVGENAYGWLKTESGVHRLVRISPYDSSARRHTSFASAWVYPEIDDTIEVDIPEGEVRVDTFRASGAGGQHVNKTDSAVRLTYTPPGEDKPVVVVCQNERSQHKNRSQAWAMLRARVYELELQKQRAEQAANEANKSEIGWGSQIRSYVLQPYQMVKDLRTGVETSDTNGVLDGALDPFMAAALAAALGEGGDAPVAAGDLSE